MPFGAGSTPIAAPGEWICDGQPPGKPRACERGLFIAGGAKRSTGVKRSWALERHGAKAPDLGDTLGATDWTAGRATPDPVQGRGPDRDL